MAKEKKQKADFKALLQELKGCSNYSEFNPFCMVNVANLETAHSFFIKELLDPNYSHKTGRIFFEELCKGVFSYPNKFVEDGIYSNEKIITTLNPNIDKVEKLIDLFPEFTPRTEKVTKSENDENGRVDIVIECVSTNSVLVIENKVDSNLHSDQLKKYQNYYKNYDNQIYIYLTKIGEKPIDSNGQYNGNWCIYDYRQIVTNIQTIIKHIVGRNYEEKYIKETLRRYCEMTTRVLLSEGDKWEIIKDYEEQIIEIKNSIDNKVETINYCYEFFKRELKNDFKEDGLKNSSSFNFHTSKIESHYRKSGNEYAYHKCTWYLGSDTGLTFIIKYDKDPTINNLVKQLERKSLKIIKDNQMWLAPLDENKKKDLDKVLNEALTIVKELDNLL